MKFITPVAMRMNSSQFNIEIALSLKEMGYAIDSKRVGNGYAHTYIYEKRAVFSKNYNCESKYEIRSYSPEAFLAIAAMTSSPSTGIEGECVIYANGSFSKLIRVSNNFARKATIEEILKHFNAIVGCDFKDQFDKPKDNVFSSFTLEEKEILDKHRSKLDKAILNQIETSPSHYDNQHGSLYKIAEQRGWNSHQFDIIKRIDRATKKGVFNEDLEKTKFLIDLWKEEENNQHGS